jgi:hypothetical protein
VLAIPPAAAARSAAAGDIRAVVPLCVPAVCSLGPHGSLKNVPAIVFWPACTIASDNMLLAGPVDPDTFAPTAPGSAAVPPLSPTLSGAPDATPRSTIASAHVASCTGPAAVVRAARSPDGSGAPTAAASPPSFVSSITPASSAVAPTVAMIDTVSHTTSRAEHVTCYSDPNWDLDEETLFGDSD